MKEPGNKIKSETVDVRHKVMLEIKEKKIAMRPAFIFLAQKLGLQSILALSIVSGALLLNILLYFLKKTGVLKFLSFGWPGLKVVLATLPYDYIFLFIITLALANYIIHQLDLSRGIRLTFNGAITILLVITVALSVFFGVNGVENTIHGWSKNSVPEEIAVSGRVLETSAGEVLIQEENGKNLRIILGQAADKISAYKPEYIKNKILRAIGEIDAKDNGLFHAEEVSCCDED